MLLGPLETISIDFALLPNVECYKLLFVEIFFRKESPEATDTFLYQSYVKFFYKMKVSIMHISKYYVNTCNLENRCYGTAIFLQFQISFACKRNKWLQNGQGSFLIKNFAGKQFYRLIEN